jgi:hypothetical protein
MSETPSLRCRARVLGLLSDTPLGVLAASLGLFALPGCQPEGCLSGADDCEVPSACPDLTFTCDAGSSEMYVLGADTVPTENDTLGAAGDVVLANDRVAVTIEALDHPHYISPTGGGIIDFTTDGKANDSLRQMFTATGVLPGDAIHYASLEMLDEGDIKAVQLLGTLEGYPDVRVATRYEVRPCEPGVRIRTEMINTSPDPLSWFLTDAFYYGDRGDLPFVPGPGMGFTYPEFGLSTLLDGFRDVPYMVANANAVPAATYADVACTEEALSGFHSPIISAVGQAPRIVMPRDYAVYERFVGAVDSASVSAGADLALDLRQQLFDEPYATLSGTVVAPGGTLGTGLRATVLVSEGTSDTPLDTRVPVTHAYPAADGTYSVRVPAGKTYVVAAEAYGRPAGEVEVDVGDSAAVAPTLTLEGAGEVTIDATIDGVADHVLVFVVPSDDDTLDTTSGQMFGHFGDCAPLLGNPHGPSPACNRVLVNGPETVGMPAGTYDFYAVAGPFSTLAAARGVRVDAGTSQSVLLELQLLDLQPEGTLTGDFHVHGGASFDSSIPDEDRVEAFLASRIQVIASTEHDTVWNYDAAMDALGAGDRLHLIEGTESTGHILFPFRSDYGFPLVIGHWNFWPVPFDPTGAWRGATWDELVEPGGLFTRESEEGGWDPDVGIVQLNHPVGGLQFGRNFGWISSTGMSLLEPPQEDYDGTGQSLFLHTPEGASFSNADYDVQEVMNGTKNEALLAYRSFWFYLLQHGIIRAGTANSDSHTLTENVLGTPRNIVYTSTTLADFDLATFDDDVRAGHMTGTTGPVLEARVTDVGGSYVPSVSPITPLDDARLEITVHAAPWVPVEEVRIIVNGVVVKTITDELSHPDDPFGTVGLERLATNVPLSEILPASGDAWIVVEAGAALADNEDLDCNGIPDTGDNNGDGTVDWKDVDNNGDLVVDALDAETPPDDADAECLSTTGPLAEPPIPERDTPEWYFRTVTPDGYPVSFTNPFLVDRDADGFTGEDE